MNEKAAYMCPRCQIGHLHPAEGTLTALHHGCMLSIPSVPIWKCDICQYREFDFEAVSAIERLTGTLDLGLETPPSPQRSAPTEFGDHNKSQRLKP